MRTKIIEIADILGTSIVVALPLIGIHQLLGL